LKKELNIWKREAKLEEQLIEEIQGAVGQVSRFYISIVF
jgi:hypothetical protein